MDQTTVPKNNPARKATKKTDDYTLEVGYVTSISNYIVWLEGLPNIRINEIVVSEKGAQGLVTSIQDEKVEVLMLNDVAVKAKESFKRTNTQIHINAGGHLLGRAINPLGQPIDGKAGLSGLGHPVLINQAVPGIQHRDLINQQFETGSTLVDILTPLALGQRELIIGDANSGKNEFLVETIVNQADRKENFVCIYAVIGKPVNSIRSIVDILNMNKASEYTVVIATSSSEKATLIYLTPIVATALAEYFQRLGKDVLLILDDMGIHAKFYREISLLSGRPPGRDSYPGDIFFQHARLVERAGKFNITLGGGSITALPVIETHLDDFTSYMTTNLMGMTDGHLLFSATRFKEGFRPSIDISLSVSRVGRQTQNLAQKFLADRVKSLLFEADKLESYSKFGTELSAQTRFTLKQAAIVRAILNQPPLFKASIIIEMILLGLLFTPFFAEKDAEFMNAKRQKIIDYFTQKIDLKGYLKEVVKFKDDKPFIESLTKIVPALQKEVG